MSLGRRIAEILEERGAAFSQRAFSQKIGVSKDTLGRMISGERPIMLSERKRIADVLAMSVERLENTDTEHATLELVELLDKDVDRSKALQIALKLYDVAVGVTERCDATVNLARAWYSIGNYERAHELFMQAYYYAEKICEKFGEKARLYNILSKLMLTFTMRKEYSNLSAILEQVETVFQSDPEKQGAICFSKAMIAEQFGNTEKVRENLNKALEFYQMTGDENSIGRAEQNVGYFEFKQKNYQIAEAMLERSIHHLRNDVSNLLIALKEYIKVLIKTGKNDMALALIQQSMPDLQKRPELHAKFNLLLSVAKQDVRYAESNLMQTDMSANVLRLTCKFLTKHYIALGDADAVLKYAVIIDELTDRDSDILDEEDL